MVLMCNILKKTFKAVIISSCIFLSMQFAELIQAGTFFVSTSGSNNGDGSSENPWATPGYASKQIQGGDTLIIRSGSYILSVFYDDMIIPPSGTEQEYTIIKGENGTILKGQDNLFSAIQLDGVHYIKIENLEITHNSDASDVRFRCGITGGYDPVSNIIMKDMQIHHIDEGGIDLRDVDGLEIINCNIHHCGFGSVMGPAAGVAGGWKNIKISGSQLSYNGHYYQGGPGPSPYDRPDGFGIEPSQGPIEIFDTIAEHNRGDGLDSKSENTYINNCIVANNSCDGIKLWGDNSKIENCLIYGTGDGNTESTPWANIVIGNPDQAINVDLVNVTVCDNPQRSMYVMYCQYDQPAPLVNLTIKNCVFSGTNVAFMGDSVSVDIDNSLFYISDQGSAQVYANGREYMSDELDLLGAGNIYGNPLFVSPAFGTDGDYHLQENSPCIDAGALPEAPSKDLDGNARPAGNGVDIGAYEYGSVPDPDDKTAPEAISDLKIDNVTGTQISLSWTASGDDGNLGSASVYDIRYGTEPINESNWASAVSVYNEPVPLAAGSDQVFTIIGLASNAEYYIAIKVIDDSNNVSLLSNIVSYTTKTLEDLSRISNGGKLISFKSQRSTSKWAAKNIIDGKRSRKKVMEHGLL